MHSKAHGETTMKKMLFDSGSQCGFAGDGEMDMTADALGDAARLMMSI